MNFKYIKYISKLTNITSVTIANINNLESFCKSNIIRPGIINSVGIINTVALGPTFNS